MSNNDKLRQAINDLFDNRPVTERIKTFEDACDWCATNGRTDLTDAFDNAHEWLENDQKDVIAYLKLRIICAALNEGWQPKYTRGEYRHYPLFHIYSQEAIDNMSKLERYTVLVFGRGDGESRGFGFYYADADFSRTDANVSARLALKSKSLAVYCGSQFVDIWADYCCITKD